MEPNHNQALGSCGALLTGALLLLGAQAIPVLAQEAPDLDPALMTPGARFEAHVMDLAALLRDKDEAVRARAATAIKALGRPVTPLLVQLLRHPDKSIARGVRAVLVELVGEPKPGPEVSGLTVAAVPVGLPPDKDACVPLWLVYKNTSQKPLRFLEVYCDLFWVTPERAARAPQDFGPGVDPGWPYDYFYPRLEPGAEANFLADADLEGAGPPPNRRDPPELPRGIQSAARGCALLSIRIRWPDAAGLEPNDRYQRHKLTSGVLELQHYDPAKATLDEQSVHDARNFSSLRLWNESARWHRFMELRDDPKPAEEDDFVDFLSRWGPRNPKGDLVGEWTRTYAEALPAHRRVPFLDRVSRAVNYTWLDNSLIAEEYLKQPRTMLEVDLVARLCRRLLDGGFPLEEELLEFASWQLYMSLDPGVRDRERARQLLAKASAQYATNPRMTFMRLTFEDRGDERRKFALGAFATDKKDLARLLATAGQASGEDRQLAVELAEAALAEADKTNRPERLDVAAAAYAARGSFGLAARTQSEALGLPGTAKLRPGYASRLIHYEALAAAPNGSVFDVSTLRDEKVHAYLIGRMQQPETPTHLLRAATDWLDILFPGDPAIRPPGAPGLDF